MTKGFYQLTSGMLSQSRRLDTVAGNLTNLSTPGYKKDLYTDRTFGEVLLSRTGNKDKSGSTEIGGTSWILAPDEPEIELGQGAVEETGGNLDFAIQGEGYFAIQTESGVAYTRNGSFSLDGAGCLTLPGHSRVLGADGQPLFLPTDEIRADDRGNLFSSDGEALGTVGSLASVHRRHWSSGQTGSLPRRDRQPPVWTARCFGGVWRAATWIWYRR